MNGRTRIPDELLADIERFSHSAFSDHRLRSYQLDPARAFLTSVLNRQGRQFAIVFSRQAGKDELLAQLLAFLLLRHRRTGGSMVLAAPTFHPQAALMRDRLVDRLAGSRLGVGVRVRDGYVVQVGRASARFLSASPEANARGQTADLLLVANEAQDIRPAVWDAVFDPMAASTNATTLFLRTVWSRETLLARQMRYLDEVARREGAPRVWRVPWEEVAAVLPAYGERVEARIEQFGRDHPFIRTEYFLEELDDAGALFSEQRLAQLQGDHPRRHRAEPDKRYALLIDVAGGEETSGRPGAFADHGKRDSTAVTVIEIDLPPKNRREGLPGYRVVDRLERKGVAATGLHEWIVDLARTAWRARAVVIDATGIGAGLASFLEAALRHPPAIQVVPFLFTSASKSRLGWDLLALIDHGRLKEYADDAAAGTEAAQLTTAFWSQMRAVTFETLPGPGKAMRWSVPDGRGHDDLVMSLALVTLLDEIDWRPRVARGGNRG
jgi:hypothetical protein